MTYWEGVGRYIQLQLKRSAAHAPDRAWYHFGSPAIHLVSLMTQPKERTYIIPIPSVPSRDF